MKTKNKNEKFIRTVADFINSRFRGVLYPDVLRKALESEGLATRRMNKGMVAAFGAAMRRAGYFPSKTTVPSIYPKARGRRIRVWHKAYKA